VKKGDTFYSLAKSMNMNVWQIYKYNDLNKNDTLNEDDIIYLQPKRNSSKVEYHVVESGETMRSISQLYGVKLKKLYKKNNMILGTQPKVGERLSLRKRVRN